jgi:hypothetical protein
LAWQDCYPGEGGQGRHLRADDQKLSSIGLYQITNRPTREQNAAQQFDELPSRVLCDTASRGTCPGGDCRQAAPFKSFSCASHDCDLRQVC